MADLDVNQFTEERDCTYDAERYSVRDNGAVLRHGREGKRGRAADNKWTFGKTASSHPYLEIAGVRIHRIVAVAFHGQPDDPKLVVDHIDTNCRNNRPENLRWLSRLENVLKNPMTRKRVEYVCGSIEAFLDDPSLLRESKMDPNFTWMRAVSQDEAKNCKTRIALWAASAAATSPRSPTRRTTTTDHDRMLRPLQKWEAGLSGEPGLDFALTPRSAQYMWNGEIYFPTCPLEIGMDPLENYERNIEIGGVLAYSDNPMTCPELRVQQFEYLRPKKAMLVMCSQEDPRWTIVGIQMSRAGIPHFIHFNLGSYLVREEAIQAYADMAVSDFWSSAYATAWKNR